MKYPGLNSVSRVAYACGWIAVIVAAMCVFLGFSDFVVASQGSESSMRGISAVQGVAKIAGGFGLGAVGLVLLLMSEGIRVVLDIETNTSKVALALAGTAPENDHPSITPIVQPPDTVPCLHTNLETVQGVLQCRLCGLRITV
jgi:hypothetical protein